MSENKSDQNKSGDQTAYRVLARKYRPRNFSELIGQDALVRTLTNAIETGRIAHAFMLTGVRGVGKTTTARIIAKALNYTGPDGKSGPTVGPTDDCEICRAITADRHPDVIEMDAASRTGVDDIREILDGVRYAPSQARYKIYIIDEVHMLSKQAFNALLKTLEEPPEHVKFIFATTEIRKVPVTVLSRCQRFDLRRVDGATIAEYFATICERENVKAQDEALSLIGRAADGSVRDGLSLLDQAMALAGGEITAQQVQDMLGLADRARNLDMLESVLSGDAAGALAVMEELHRAGADPSVIMQDLLDLTHILTRLHAVPGEAGQSANLAPDQLKRARELAARLSMPSLGKAWQILLKGLSEVNMAPAPQAAAEMVLIRLSYAANLPDPADLIRKLKDNPDVNALAASMAASSHGAGAGQTLMQGGHGSSMPHGGAPSSNAPVAQLRTVSGGGRSGALAVAAVSQEEIQSGAQSRFSPREEAEQAPYADFQIRNLEDMIVMLEEAREYLLASQLYQFAHVTRLEAGRFDFRPASGAQPKLATDLSRVLKALTGRAWMVVIAKEGGAPTIAQGVAAAKAQEFAGAKLHPAVMRIIEMFPGADLVDIKTADDISDL